MDLDHLDQMLPIISFEDVVPFCTQGTCESVIQAIVVFGNENRWVAVQLDWLRFIGKPKGLIRLPWKTVGSHHSPSFGRKPFMAPSDDESARGSPGLVWFSPNIYHIWEQTSSPLSIDSCCGRNTGI